MRKILIINGTPRSGKDSFCDFIKIFCEEEKIYYLNISTVDHIKEIARNNFGWNGIKDAAGRQLLSDLKDASIRYNNGPFNYCVQKITEKENHIYEYRLLDVKNDNFIFTIHCREPSEIEKFKRYYGEDCITIFIKREIIEKDVDCYCDQPDYLKNYNYDFIINNNKALVDLKAKAISLISIFRNQYYYATDSRTDNK